MGRKLFNFLVLLPIAIVLVVFAVANRHFVTVSFDPFSASDSALSVSLPLFLVIILSVIAGVLAGGVVTWLRQGRWRRAARRHQAEAAAAKAELSAGRPVGLPGLAIGADKPRAAL
jgi:uncharacterized integral membrane protein